MNALEHMTERLSAVVLGSPCVPQRWVACSASHETLVKSAGSRLKSAILKRPEKSFEVPRGFRFYFRVYRARWFVTGPRGLLSNPRTTAVLSINPRGLVGTARVQVRLGLILDHPRFWCAIGFGSFGKCVRAG